MVFENLNILSNDYSCSNFFSISYEDIEKMGNFNVGKSRLVGTLSILKLVKANKMEIFVELMTNTCNSRYNGSHSFDAVKL